jgi:hypothetical protein
MCIESTSRQELKRLQRTMDIYYCFLCGKQIDCQHNARMAQYYERKKPEDTLCVECIEVLSAKDLSKEENDGQI